MSRPPHVLTLASALALVLLTSVNCSRRPERVPLAGVWGHVTVDGEPIRYGQVVFIPDRQRGNAGPIGRSVVMDNAGLYWLGTYRNEDGAAVGWHRVSIHSVASPDEASPELLPGAFNTHSELRVFVAPGRENVIDFHLTTRPKPLARIERKHAE